jgi:hypothetical protein
MSKTPSFDMDLEEAINWYAASPPIPDWYIPETTSAKEEIERLQHGYYCTGQLLKYLMLSKPESDASRKGNYVAARHGQLLYDLVTGVQLALKNLPGWGDASPARIWFSCNMSDALLLLDKKGISSLIETGIATPQIESKTDILMNNAEVSQLYNFGEPSNHRNFAYLTQGEFFEWLKKNFRGYLEDIAFDIAQKQRRFRELYWNPYQKGRQALDDLVRKDEAYQFSYLLPTGEIVTTGKHIKLPKGFDSEIRLQQSYKRRQKRKQTLLQELNKNTK